MLRIVLRLSVLVCCIFTVADLALLPASADVIQFNDLTSSLSVTSTNTGRVASSCSSSIIIGESCEVTLSAPSPGATVSVSPVSSVFIADTDGVLVSDEFVFLEGYVGSSQLLINFHSYLPGAMVGTCIAVGGCSMTEDGTLQTAPVTVTWTDGTVDSFKFQSVDSTAVPEPSSILLVTTGTVFILWKARGPLKRKVRRAASQVV